MNASSMWAFWAVSVALVLTPGADWSYAISSGIKGRSVVPAVVGLLIGYVVMTVVVAAGVGAVIAATPAAMTFIRYAGAAYLVWIGVNVLRNPPVPGASGEIDLQASASKWLLGGIAVTSLNPKGLLLFLVLLPQFLTHGSDVSATWQMIVLGLLHTLNCAAVYFSVGHGARAVLGTRPALARRVSQASGVIMIVLGAILVFD